MFKKSDLKDGMLLLFKNGKRYVMANGCPIGYGTIGDCPGFLNMNNYNDNMENISPASWVRDEFLLVKVFNFDVDEKKWVEVPQFVQKNFTLDEKLQFNVTILGNKITVSFEENGETFDGVAVCDKGDVFDENTGIKIALLKARIKYLNAHLKTFQGSK